MNETDTSKMTTRKKPNRAAKLKAMELGQTIQLRRSDNKYKCVSSQIAALQKDCDMKWSYKCSEKLIYVTRIK